MVRSKLVAVAGFATLLAAGGADAQTSLFGQPAAPQAAEDAPPAAPAPRARPKRPAPAPARALTIANDSTGTVTDLEVSAEGKSARLAEPLGPKGRATLRLPAIKACVVTVTTTFEGSPDPDTSSQDICKDRRVRFTD